MEKNKNKWQWALGYAGVLAAAALLWGCLNPVSGLAPDGTDGGSGDPGSENPGSSNLDQSPAGAAGIAEGEFNLTLKVGGGGDSRSVVGPEAEGVQFSGIRNIVEVIQVDADTRTVVHFQQVKRANDKEPSVVLTVVNPHPGRKYHFLVLTGHQERDYQNGEDPDTEYKYKEGAPTLLAAGLLTDREIKGGETISINMRPLMVDTVFKYGVNTVEAALAGVELPAGAAAGVVWTLTGGGFDTLLDAQNKVILMGSGLGLNWGELSTKNRKTILDWTVSDSPKIVVKNNQITLSLGAQGVGVEGLANFNLEYFPFGVNDLNIITGEKEADGWIIRNGVNDKAQDEKTVFPTSSMTVSPWDDKDDDTGKNGNGAVVFTFVDRTIPSVDLTIPVPRPVKGAMPKMDFDMGKYKGTVSWNKLDDTAQSNAFEADTEYKATVTLYPGPEFTFPETVAVTHTGSTEPGDGAHEFEHGDGEEIGTVSGIITFAATDALPVTDLDLTEYLRVPEKGKNPQTALFLYNTSPDYDEALEPPQYSGTVVWTDSDDMEVEEDKTFNDGETYTATVTLTAKQGYTFAANTIFVYAKTNIPANNAAEKSITVTIRDQKAPGIPVTW